MENDHVQSSTHAHDVGFHPDSFESETDWAFLILGKVRHIYIICLNK